MNWKFAIWVWILLLSSIITYNIFLPCPPPTCPPPTCPPPTPPTCPPSTPPTCPPSTPPTCPPTPCPPCTPTAKNEPKTYEEIFLSSYSNIWKKEQKDRAYSAIVDLDEMLAWCGVSNFYIYSSLLGIRLKNEFLPWDPVNYVAVDELKFIQYYSELSGMASKRGLSLTKMDSNHYILSDKHKDHLIKISLFEYSQDGRTIWLDNYLIDKLDVFVKNDTTSRRSLEGFMVNAPRYPDKVLEVFYTKSWKNSCTWIPDSLSNQTYTELQKSSKKYPCPAISDRHEYNFVLSDTAPSSIPRHIHQLWIGNEKKPPYHLIDTCKNIYQKDPSYTYTFWNDSTIGRFDIIHSKTFQNVNASITEADLLRLAVLYEFGGIWLDTDNICWRSLEDLMEHEVDVIVGYHLYKNYKKVKTGVHEKLLATSVVGTVKENYLFKLMIEELVRDTDRVVKCCAWINTGPGLFTKWFQDPTKKSIRIGIYPYYYFCPYDDREPRNTGKTERYKSFSENVFREEDKIKVVEGVVVS